MKAMVMKRIVDLSTVTDPLEYVDWPMPVAGEGELLVRVLTCGVCHTELDEIEGRTPPPVLPAILGHQVVGRVVGQGTEAGGITLGSRVGVAWIYSSCGTCRYCREGNENLCPDFSATGRDAPGGYAEYLKVRADFAYPVPDALTDAEAAPCCAPGPSVIARSGWPGCGRETDWV